jgi:hypothetical protein
MFFLYVYLGGVCSVQRATPLLADCALDEVFGLEQLRAFYSKVWILQEARLELALPFKKEGVQLDCGDK